MTGLSLALLLACGCKAPSVADTAPAGRGLLRVDEAAPPGAATWERPEWRVGERFRLLRGDRQQGTLTVVAAGADGYTLDTGLGMLLKRDRDLANLGEWRADGTPKRLLAPSDRRYHWPLWVGKAWSCEFVDQAGDGAGAMTMQADYLVEAVDTIKVPAGTFEALRIVRRVRLLGRGEFLTRMQMTWYAPAIGAEVRQLAGDSSIELVASER